MKATDEIIAQISKALAAHSFWPTHLRTAIDQGTSTHDPESIRQADQCSFGRWLNKNNQELSSCPEYGKACELHAKFHAATSQVMQLALSGNADEASASIAEDGEFGRISSDLTRAMISWKKRAAA